jgi:hypothetical protein
MANLYKVLIDLQETIKPIKKDAKGQVGNRPYTYADLPSILEIIKPILKKEGIGILIKTIPSQLGDRVGNTQTVVIFDDEGNREETSLFIELQETPQSTGIWKTYCRRYSIGDLLNLSLEEDTDGDLGSVSSPTQKKEQQKPKTEYPKPLWNYGVEAAAEIKDQYWGELKGEPFKKKYGCELIKIGFKYYVCPVGTYNLFKNNPQLQAYTVESLRALNYEGMSEEEKAKFDTENAF